MEYKQVILVRKDLKLPKGKLASQVAHASVEAVLKSEKYDKDSVKNWRAQGMKKIVLQVENEAELHKFNQMAKETDLVTALISDAGHTVVEPGTVTCLAIGPDEEEKVDRITGKLKML